MSQCKMFVCVGLDDSKVVISIWKIKNHRWTEKIWRCRIASIVGWRLYTNTTTNGREVKCWLLNHLWSSACHFLLSRRERKNFMNSIITGDEKWIYFGNSKCRKSLADPGQPSTSTVRPNCFGKMTMLCISSDQKDVVYHMLLKPGGTVNTFRYLQQMMNLNHASIEKRPE